VSAPRGPEPGFRIIGPAVIRTVAGFPTLAPPLPDLTVAGPDSGKEWVSWLRDLWAIPDIAEAIGHASPALDREVHELCVAASPSARRARRVVLAVTRYLLRAAGRPTPWGLMAGVATARFSSESRARWGSAHEVVARADAGWLAHVIGELERAPEVVERLPVVVNSTLIVQGDRLIVPYQAIRRDEGGVGAADVSLRFTTAVLAAIRRARHPVRFGHLASDLAAEFPGTCVDTVRGLLAELVRSRVLITSLHAPSTEPDALGWLVEQAGKADLAEVASAVDTVAALRDIESLLVRHNQEFRSRGRGLRAEAARRMLSLADGGRHPLALDLRLDADVTLPGRVAREVERAALVLARMSPHPFGVRAWRDYHRRFYQRYGAGALVPLLDATADSGIGWPAGYPGGPTSPAPSEKFSRRDAALLALAQASALDGQHEVALDEALITGTGATDAEKGTQLPPHLEMCVRLLASDFAAVERGDFRVEVVSVSRAAGVMAGRFLQILDPTARSDLTDGLADLRGSDPEALCAQLSFVPLDPRSAHVARAPRVLTAVVSFAEHRDPDDPAVLTAHDLAVGCDGHRLYLAAPAMGKRVEAWGLHALNLRIHTPPLARFVTELSRAQCAQVSGFDWGAASQLPFLPRVRYGRVILAPARWRLSSADMPAQPDDWARWDAALAKWRGRRRLPRWVSLTDDQQQLPLDLEHTGHRALLRDHLRKRPVAVLEEAPDPQVFGWCGGRAHEVVVPLAASGSRAWPRSPRPTAARLVGRDLAKTPGAADVLFVKLSGAVSQQDSLLCKYLPMLLAEWEGERRPVWWFLRFREGSDHHLRLRISLPDAASTSFGEAAGRVGAWADGLRRRGLLRDVEYSTSYPQTGQWGDGNAQAAAEAVFAADSAAVVAQLGEPRRPHSLALVAANFAAIASAFTGSITAGMGWLIDNIDAKAPAATARPVFAEAVRLSDPRDDFEALRQAPGGAAIVEAWAPRTRTLPDYRAHFPGPHTSGVDPDDVLGALLHAHFLRARGVEPDEKALSLYLARAAAMAYFARTGGRR